MREVGKCGHHEQWIAAVNAKYNGDGDIPTKETFGNLFRDYEVCNSILN